MIIEKLASAIINDVVSGLRGYHHNPSINQLQLEDEIVQTRLEILETYFLKGILPIKDLLLAINCIKIDCKDLERCACGKMSNTTPTAHFEIPQIINIYGKNSINYIGSIDRKNQFKVYTSLSEINTNKYRKINSNKPYVWVDTAPNENGMLDCYLFNAPFLENISVVAAFKDPRQLKKYKCCNTDNLIGSDTNFSFIDQAVKEKLTKEKLQYYRQFQPALKPNTQSYE